MTLRTVHFAHLTDIHLSKQDRSWSTVSTLAPRLLQEAINELNQIRDLDFILFTGDILDTGSDAEAHLFRDTVKKLNAPWHLIPGNHDGFVDPENPTALKPEQAMILLDPRLADPVPYAGRAWWSRSFREGIQIIGLDSRLEEDWSGVVNQDQLAWLSRELEAHRSDLVILAVHHPLHNLGPHNTRGRFTKFICDNGPEVESLLDNYPNVRIVLSGHHHANHISRANRGGRLHVCTAALSGYQCVFRTIRMTDDTQTCRVEIKTHSTIDSEGLETAFKVAVADKMAHEFDESDPTAWARFCAGRPEDLSFEGVLS